MLTIKLLYLVIFLPVLPTTPSGQGQPRIRFTETQIDLGKIPNMGTVNTELHFENTGTGPLIIQGTKTACTCTAVKPEKRAFAPGEKGTIPITFRPTSFQGKVKKKITIFTNDPKNKKTVCYLIADVLVDVFVMPKLLYVNDVRSNDVGHGIIRIYTKQMEQLNITDLQSDREFIIPTLRKIDNKSYELDILVEGFKVPKGQNRSFANLTFKTNSKSQQEMTTQIQVTLKDPLSVSPATAYCFGMNGNEEYEYDFKVRTVDGSKISLLSWNLDLEPAAFKEHIEVKYTKLAEQSKDFKIAFHKNNLDGRFKGKLRIKTDHPAQLEIVIPIQGSVK